MLYGLLRPGRLGRRSDRRLRFDYDILIVVNDERLTDFELWSAAEDRLMRDVTVNKVLSAPVSFIVHTLTDVNQQLEKGRPFFVDIVKQGIALYGGGRALRRPARSAT